MTDQPATPDNPATNRIHAPWTADQVAALERFQTEGHMHPFTCGGDQHSMAPRLVPSRSGWHCPDPDCAYMQDWAHAFMAQPAAWPKPWLGQQHRLTAAPYDPEVERKAEERAAQAAADSERSAAWFAAQQADTGLREQYAAAMWAKAEHTIIAEWICCEPLDPKHDLCAQGYAALRMVKALIVDDPKAATSAPLADVVLAVRDREMERMQLLVAASSEPGQAVRMAAQYADRAIENGERAEQAKAELVRVQERACRTAELLRHAEDRVARLEKLLADELTALDQPQQATTNHADDEATPIAPDPHQPAFDAVFAYIRSQPTDFLPATVVERNAMIWRAIHAALQAQQPTA